MKRIANCALALILALVLAVPAWALNEWDMPADEYVFYSQLSEYGRSIYEEMCKPESLACFRSGESFTMRFNGPFDDFNAASQTIFAASSAALSAFELNHPNLFWLKGSSDGTSGNTGRIDLTVTPHFAENWSSGGRSTASDEAAVTAVVQQIAAEASVQGGPYQQLLYAHDWLTKHNIYNGTAAAADAAGDYLPWTPLSALTDGLSPVCEGYAKAFQLICGELGYPCIMVDGLANGAGHSWNQVQIAGQWYAVDVTYDDPTVSGIGSPDSGYETRDHFLGARTRSWTAPTALPTRISRTASASRACTSRSPPWPPRAWTRHSPGAHRTLMSPAPTSRSPSASRTWTTPPTLPPRCSGPWPWA
jgi:hypothetical protein